MNPFGYSDAVWRLFTLAPRSGALKGPQVRTGTATTPVNNSRLQITARVEGDRVEDARFRAFGCPTAIAVGAWLADRAIGRPLTELAAISAAAICQAREIPENRLHCALLGEDAVKSLSRST
jgi:NifU-like protein involved in Fe-S cluster formation